MIEYPTLEELLAMHEILLAEFGGAGGVRDRGALESALMRPQLGYYETLVAQAAALMESLAQNHPFVDGNKRVAFFATDTFLRMNGYYVDCDGEQAHAFFMDLFDRGAFRFEQLATWLEAHVERLPGGR
jgi:death on curing protein